MEAAKHAINKSLFLSVFSDVLIGMNNYIYLLLITLKTLKKCLKIDFKQLRHLFIIKIIILLVKILLFLTILLKNQNISHVRKPRNFTNEAIPAYDPIG